MEEQLLKDYNALREQFEILAADEINTTHFEQNAINLLILMSKTKAQLGLIRSMKKKICKDCHIIKKEA
jgi:RNase P subunit RPR2